MTGIEAPLATFLAEEVLYEGPQTRERVRGRANDVRFNVEGFPGDWHLVVIRIIGEGPHASRLIEFTNTDGGASQARALSFWSFRTTARSAADH